MTIAAFADAYTMLFFFSFFFQHFSISFKSHGDISSIRGMFYSTFLKWNLISLKAHKLMPMTSYASLGYDDVIVYFKLAMSK